MGEANVLVTGGTGLVGSAIVRELQRQGVDGVVAPTRQELDLLSQQSVFDWFLEFRPRFVYLVAGRVGGISANSALPASFIYENLVIHSNVIEAARRSECEKLLYLGSSCIYPRDAAQPIAESSLLTGPLESTNEWYAVAKIAGIKMCDAYRRQYGCDFISAMPTNLYGPNDNFDLESSHVLPALIRKFFEARQIGQPVLVWGTGEARREFLHVDDLARACVLLMQHYSAEGHINIGTGEDVRIRDLVELIRSHVFPEADVRYVADRPDGTPRKVLDVSRIRSLGWRHSIELEEGIRSTYEWLVEARRLGGVRGWPGEFRE